MRKTLADMARSLGLMAVVVAAMLFIGARYLIAPGSADRMPAADYSSVVSGFRDATNVAALAPTDVPPTWRANAARLFSPAAGSEQLHIGWAVPGSRYAGLDEATGDPAAVVSSVLGQSGSTVHGTTEIAGARWDLRRSDRGETAFTRQVGRVLVLVTGNATDAELRGLAGSLR